MKKICLLCLAIFSMGVLLAQPEYDDPCNAEMLTIGADCSTTLPYTNVGATALNGEGFSCYPDESADHTVWFTFVPTLGAVSISTDFGAVADSSDTQLTVYELSGSDCSIIQNYISLYCNEDILPEPENSYFNAGLPAVAVNPGSTYYIQVDAFNNDPDAAVPDTNPGSFCILVSEFTPPSNDECANAIPFGGFGANSPKVAGNLPALTGNLTTVGATASAALDSLSCDSEGYNATVFYSFPFGNDATAEVEFQLLSGENVNVAVLEAGCELSPGVVSNNCVNGLNGSDETATSANAALFSGLEAGNTYNLVIWTNEGDETEFNFSMIKRPAGFYTCGDNECYDLAESYTNCEADCPCISSIDLYSLTTGAASDTPTGVCAEVIGGSSEGNPGIYVPFVINTLDSDLSGSMVTTTVGSLFTSNTSTTAFGVSNPLIALPNNEANDFINYVFLTQAEIDAGGTVTISFTSDAGACSASIDMNLADLQAPNSNDCGNCNLVVAPDYSTLQCPGFNVTLDIQGAIGNLWLSQNNTIVNDPGDIALPYTGAYPESDFTLIIYDEGQPNCTFVETLTFGDFSCDDDGNLGTFCRLDPAFDDSKDIICEDGTANVLVPIDFVNNVTGNLTSMPDIVSVVEGTYYAAVDPANCAPIEIMVSDESDVDAFSGVPIFTINAPASIAGGYANVGTNSADDWGVDVNLLGVCGSSTTEVTGTLVLVNDGSSEPTIFCNPDGGTPTDEQCTGIAGNIAVIDRGSCAFVNKASNAQQCGAIAVLICNNDVANPDDILQMGGTMPGITIPTIMLSFNDCIPIKAELANGVEACIGAPQTVPGCSRTFTLDVCDQIADIVCEVAVPGCMDDTACNYNPEATEDDGTCQLPPAEPATECYQTATLDNATCTWSVTGEQEAEPQIACYQTTTFDDVTCTWVTEGMQPNVDDGCDLTTDTFDETTCMVVNTSTCPDNTNLNTTTCMCEDVVITGCTDACATNYDPMANSDDGSCTLPEEPTIECYQTATFNTTTCMWEVTGEQDMEPETACYETANFNETTCMWEVTGEQDMEPETACYETAAFNTTTCMWEVTGEQNPEPTTACYETATFDDATCDWVVTGDQPEQPTDLACYQTVGAFDDATCNWQVLGEQPIIDDGCDLTTDTFDDATCMAVNTSTCDAGTTLDEVNCMCVTDVVEGCTDSCASNYDPMANSDDGSCMLPEAPATACYETTTFNTESCMWETSGMQPEAPATECYETADFDDATCSWVISGERDPEPTGLACYETTSFDDATCAWVTVGEQPTIDDGCDLTTDTFDEATCMAVNTPNCDAGTSFDAANCACTSDPIEGCTDDTACNYDPNATVDNNTCTFLPDEPTNLACYETATANLTTCSWDVTGDQPTIDDGCDVTVDTFDDATCMAVNTPDCADGTTYNAADCACDPITVEVMGCTDMDACNFDSAANIDDASCVYAVAGTISTTSSTSICVNDGVDEPIDVTVDDAGQGANGAWVITDSDAIILALPAEPPFVLDGAGVGTCLIWWVNFTDDAFAPAVGDDAAAIVAASSCAALSNSIAVTRAECGAECTPPSAGDFNCE